MMSGDLVMGRPDGSYVAGVSVDDDGTTFTLLRTVVTRYRSLAQAKKAAEVMERHMDDIVAYCDD